VAGRPGSAYAYLGEIFVFFVLVLYIFVNLANLVYHARFHRAVNDFLARAEASPASR
jgi:hypothetical protein